MRNDFAIFILSHGRPDVPTVKTMLNCGYTGKYYIFIDDEDDKEEEYRKNFGDHIIQFSKKPMVGTFDLFDNFPQRNTVNFARNMCFRKARELGIKYFAEFDDDYSKFSYRYLRESKENETGEEVSLGTLYIKDFDSVCNAMIEFLDNSGARCIAMAQNGEMQGGALGRVWVYHARRKSMNTFFFKVTDNPEEDVWFIGRMNDDVNTYVNGGRHGELWYQNARLNVLQGITQANKSGLTDMYKQFGTYNKSFYTVMLDPSAVKVGVLGTGENGGRMHHRIFWNFAVPYLLNEKWKKK